jgi:7-cyano-7-deazaguanine synthase
MGKVIVLLSGGLDSTTCLAFAKRAGHDVYALSFDYGQRHMAELKAASRIAEAMGASAHQIIKISINDFGGSALTDMSIGVPDYAGNNKIPVTYVPARNTIFLSMALAWAEVLDAEAIYIGVNAVDYSGYPDCRPEYLKAFQTMANLATKRGVEGTHISIRAPLLDLGKAQTIQLGVASGVDYSLTVSCYQATDDGRACGRCDSCYLRKKGFAEAGIADPTLYQ